MHGCDPGAIHCSNLEGLRCVIVVEGAATEQTNVVRAVLEVESELEKYLAVAFAVAAVHVVVVLAARAARMGLAPAKTRWVSWRLPSHLPGPLSWQQSCNKLNKCPELLKRSQPSSLSPIRRSLLSRQAST